MARSNQNEDSNFLLFLSTILHNIYCCATVEDSTFELLHEFYLIFALIVLGSFYVSKLKFHHIVLCLTMKINSLIKLTVKWPTRYSEILVRINHNKMETNRCKIIGLHKHLLAKYCKIKESKSYNSWINNSSPTRVVYLKQMNVHMYYVHLYKWIWLCLI